MLKVGVDIGGTFTDLIFIDEETGKFAVGKILTTPKDPSVGAIEGLRELLGELSLEAGQLHHIIHGTTLVANALIERRGAVTGLVTTRGFRDALEIGRERRYDVYDIFLEMPEPLVPRPLRLEVTERVDFQGKVLSPLDEAEAAAVANRLKGMGVESVAVVFLHSYKNAAHELKMREIIEREASGLFISLSHEVMPEIREFERASTTAANAYTQPLMRRYIARFREELERIGFKGSFFIMLSSGGITAPDTAERFPVRVVESGPAAGAIAAGYFGELLGSLKVLSFDMGGTTAKACLIDGGRPLITTDFEVARIYRFKKGSGLPIRLPVIDMIEIGAGGGSIACIDGMGLLKVGPQSAGADPGPSCYDLGGTEPTVTDADLVLGYLDPRFFLGGKMTLDEEKAKRAIEEKVARPLGVDLIRAAAGICEVVDENMANATRIYAVDKGEDPRNYVMVAFGGAGPVHAYGVARKLTIGKVCCPFRAGVISALGFLIAPFSFDLVQSYVCRLDQMDYQEVNRIFRSMEETGAELLMKAGLPREKVSFTRTSDMRYHGQGYEIRVPIPGGVIGPEEVALIQRTYDQEYVRLFKRTIPGAVVEALNWRVVASGPVPLFSLETFSSGARSLEGARKGFRPVFFAELGRFQDSPVYDRYLLGPGTVISGPAVIEERESTAIVGPRATAEFDSFLNLIMHIRAEGR